jgi:hypothetical protein
VTITGSMTVFWVSTGIILFNCFALGWLIGRNVRMPWDRVNRPGHSEDTKSGKGA